MNKHQTLKKSLIILLTILLLCGCQTNPFKPHHGETAGNQIVSDLKYDVEHNKELLDYKKSILARSVYKQLLPPLTLQRSPYIKHDYFDVNVQNYPANAFFKKLISHSHYNAILASNVKGYISLQLNQVTLPEILQALQDNYGYIYQIKDYGIKIEHSELQTKTFRVNYIDMQRTGLSNTTVVGSGELTGGGSAPADEGMDEDDTTTAGGYEKPSTSIDSRIHTDFWGTLKKNLLFMVGNSEGKGVIINPQAGIVIVRAYPKMLEQVSEYLDALQSIMSREVIIEAKVLQIRLNKDFQAGVDWTLLGANQDSDQNFTDDRHLNPFSHIFSLSMHSGNDFKMTLHLLSDQGNVQVLSNPRISTLNNQKAVIKVGEDEYFITNVKSTTLDSGLGSGENTQDVSLTPFFSGIALDVTPEISGNDNITLHIHPVISTVRESTIKYKINDKEQSIPSAASEIKESDSVVRAKNGQIVVIGGLMQNETSEYMANTPFLGKMPFFGALFRRNDQIAQKTELVILLKPMVVNNQSWESALKEARNRFSQSNKGFHIGGHLKRFGNEAEFHNQIK